MSKAPQDTHSETSRETASTASPLEAQYQVQAPAMLNYTRRYTNSREDAEDIVLAVFVAALESNIIQERSWQEQGAWLWRVLKNKTADYRRRISRIGQRTSGTLEAAGETAIGADEWLPDVAVVRGEADTELREAVSSLPALQQTILHLRFAQGMRSKEIAQRLNKSEGAVRMLLSRSLNVLRHRYEQQVEGVAQHEQE